MTCECEVGGRLLVVAVIMPATPMSFAGITVPQKIKHEKPAIWLDPTLPSTGRARIQTHAENPKYPETKFTMKNVIHNQGQFPVTERVGKESYDPVSGNGQSVRRHAIERCGCARRLNEHPVLPRLPWAAAVLVGRGQLLHPSSQPS